MSVEKKNIREIFRTKVFERDKHQCKFCEISTDLDAHHITDRSKMPNGGYVLQNGITLCKKHHLMAEVYHLTEGRSYHPGFHPNELYRLVRSSLEEATSASKKLCQQKPK